MAGYLSAIALTARLVCEAGIMPFPYADPVAPLWEEIQRQYEDADRTVAALQDIATWAWGNEAAFQGRTDLDRPSGTRGWLGAWNPGETWSSIAFLPAPLEDYLKDRGYDAKAILHDLRERDLLETNANDKHIKKKVQRGDIQTRCYVIKRAAFEL